MNRTRQILKKSAAAVLCASLILSGSSTAFAAGSYQETEKAALNKLTDGIPETWDTYLENYKKSAAGSKSNMTLKVEDTGRALIGALMGGTDVSWLQSISLDSNISIKDGVEAIVSSVLLNFLQNLKKQELSYRNLTIPESEYIPSYLQDPYIR